MGDEQRKKRRSSSPRRILAVATQGSGTSDEDRLRALLEKLDPEVFAFDRADKFGSFRRLFGEIYRERPDLVCLEGTGIAGGAAILLSRLLLGTRYVVSSGDAVGPFVAAQKPALGPVFGLYEKLLCRYSAGFIGWTPYLTGRALSLGARRAMTAPGWSPFHRTRGEAAEARRRVRARLGIPESAIVIGIAGSLNWNPRVGYCYGWELVTALSPLERADVRVIVLGDGSGLEELRRLAGPGLDRRFHLPGRVPRDEVADFLAAMDLASLPQSVDAVGSFRYTTKISEYLSMRLPIVTGQIPLAYDLPGDWLWRLPGDAPWDPAYVEALRELLATVTPEAIAAKRAAIPDELPAFDERAQKERVTEFIRDLEAALTGRDAGGADGDGDGDGDSGAGA